MESALTVAEMVDLLVKSGQPLSYGIEAAAKVLDVSPRLVREMVDAGELPSFRVRRRVLIARDDLVEYIGRQRALSRGVSANGPANTSLHSHAAPCRKRRGMGANDAA
jgi:excisionase family DNA binding protein